MNYLFWIVAALLCLLGIAWMLRVFRRSSAGEDSTHEGELVEIYRQRMHQLEQQHKNGEIEPEDYQTARDELEAALAAELPESAGAGEGGTESPTHNKRWIWGIGAVVPVAAVLLYLSLGEPRALSPEGLQAQGQDNQQVSVETMVARLEARLESDPDDAEGWAMLGRSYTALGEPVKAREAYAEAVQRAPENPRLLLDYAEAVARTNNNSLAGEPKMLIDKALQQDPESKRGRILRGVAALHEGDHQKAINQWVDLLNESSTSEKERQLLNQFIAAAAERSRQPAETPQAEAPAPASEDGIRVRVDVSDELRDRVESGDTVFVYARATSGPPMPLAIERHTAKDLPLDIVLDDSDAMMEQMKLSSIQQVVVLARISKSGNAQPSPGDFQTTSGTLNPAKSPEIELTIDQVVP